MKKAYVFPGQGSQFPGMAKELYASDTAAKKLFEGILPKIDNAFAAINAGVKEVLIGDARHLLQNITSNVKGTLIM